MSNANVPSAGQRSAKLLTGTIQTTFDDNANSEQLFGFGERINPRRSFVFVSRVLGRHIPVAPSKVRQSFTELAHHLPTNLPGPVLITSMAETAVGLGAGVHDAYLRQTGRADVLNLSSTRAHRPQKLFAQFSEDHSHASGHTLYLPEAQHDRDLLRACKTLVMVDDETSSGNTMRSLAGALYDAGIDQIQHCIALTLTDWSSNTIKVPSNSNEEGFIVAQRYALLNGEYQWFGDVNAPVQALPDPDSPTTLASEPLQRLGDARIGNSAHTTVAIPKMLAANTSDWKKDTKPVLVLGTGEHVWEPMLLAEALENIGLNVLFSSTTRSPIKLGHDISCAFTFKDHENLNIRNYLYNVDPKEFSNIIVCVDTSIEQLDPALIKALGAHIVFNAEFTQHENTTAFLDSTAPLQLQQLPSPKL